MLLKSIMCRYNTKLLLCGFNQCSSYLPSNCGDTSGDPVDLKQQQTFFLHSIAAAAAAAAKCSLCVFSSLTLTDGKEKKKKNPNQ